MKGFPSTLNPLTLRSNQQINKNQTSSPLPETDWSEKESGRVVIEATSF